MFNVAVLLLLAVMVFVPLKYIYPNRTVPLRPMTLTLGIIWGVLTIAMLLMLPTVNPIMLWAGLSYIAYYFIASFVLHARFALKAHRARRSEWPEPGLHSAQRRLRVVARGYRFRFSDASDRAARRTRRSRARARC